MKWRWVADAEEWGGRVICDALGLEADLMACGDSIVLIWSLQDEERIFRVDEAASA